MTVITSNIFAREIMRNVSDAEFTFFDNNREHQNRAFSKIHTILLHDAYMNTKSDGLYYIFFTEDDEGFRTNKYKNINTDKAFQ